MTAILNVLFEITVYSAILYGAILFFKKVFHKHMSAALNYAVWGLLVIRLLIPVTIDSGFSLIVIPEQEKAAVVQSILAEDADTVEQANNASSIQQTVSQDTQDTSLSDPAANTNTNGINENNRKSSVSWTIDWQTGLVMLWAAGVAGSLIYFIVFWRKLNRKIKRNNIFVPSYINDLIEECKKEVGVKKGIRVSMHDWLNSPALSAALRPKLLLPTGMLEMSRQQVEFGIRHELTHYKRKDHLMTVLLVLLRCVYWFNPVVWIAFPQIQTDMETVCDAGVTSGLHKTERISYINTMVELSCKTNVRYVLGMGMCKGRKALEKRVRGVFMKKKTKPSVRMAAILLAGVMMMACFTTACQPTPEEKVVIQKDTDYTKVTSADSTNDLSETHKNDEFEANTNIVKIDANIQNFDTSIPVAIVNDQTFNQDDVDKIIQCFFSDTKIYPTKYMEPTKQDYQDMILQDREELTKWENYDNLTDEEKAKLDWLSTPAENIERLNQEISEYEKAYENAPDKQDVEESDGQLNSEGMLDIQGVSSDNETLKLTVFPKSLSYSVGDHILDTHKTQTSGDTEEVDINSIPEDILSVASDTLNKIGVPSFYAESAKKCISSTYGDYYHIEFAQTVNDIPILNTMYCPDTVNGDNPDNHKDQELYAEPIAQPTLYIDISQNGKILALDWSSKISDISITQDNVTIKSFEDIYDIFKKNIAFRNFSPNGKPVTLEINKISLGLMVARQKNNPNGIIIIPVWDFIGTYNFAEVAGGSGGTPPEGYEKPEFSFLTINAIDGSTINRNLGY